jgi:hypothetical protein
VTGCLTVGCRAMQRGYHDGLSGVIGPALFILLAFVAMLAAAVVIRALTTPRVVAHQPVHPGSRRPCAVYEIDLFDGRKYIGYGFVPHSRIMQSHRKAAWFKLTTTAQYTFEPDRVDWYDDEDKAHAEEVARIRAANPKTLVNKVLYKSGAAQR